jgi:hypothetical protein
VHTLVFFVYQRPEEARFLLSEILKCPAKIEQGQSNLGMLPAMPTPHAHQTPYAEVCLTFFDPQTTTLILQAVQEAGLDAALRRFPLKRLDVLNEISARKIGMNAFGAYSPNGIRNPGKSCPRIYLHHPSRLDRLPLGEAALQPGLSPAVSVVDSLVGFSQATLVHELGHHLCAVVDFLTLDSLQAALARGNPVSQYANFDEQEYFCESLAAYTYYRKILKTHDPKGYNFIRETLAALKSKGS